MSKIVKITALAVLLIALTSLVGWVVSYSIDRSIEVDCQRLLRQSQNYSIFWITPQEKDMCGEIGITIDAPVNNPYEQ